MINMKDLIKKQNDMIRKESGMNIKEVGAAADYHKLNKQIEKSYRKYWDEVKDFEDLLVKKGLKPAAKEIHKKYAKDVLGFQVWLRGKLERLL